VRTARHVGIHFVVCPRPAGWPIAHSSREQNWLKCIVLHPPDGSAAAAAAATENTRTRSYAVFRKMSPRLNRAVISEKKLSSCKITAFAVRIIMHLCVNNSLMQHWCVPRVKVLARSNDIIIIVAPPARRKSPLGPALTLWCRRDERTATAQEKLRIKQFPIST